MLLAAALLSALCQYIRGVPFIEKTVNTQEDIEVLKSRNYSNPAASPLASVATQAPAANETPAFSKPPASPQNTSPAPLTNTNNPAGIRF
jgi:hypothetical protein